METTLEPSGNAKAEGEAAEAEKTREVMLHNKELAFGLKFMYENYSLDSWYWETIEMARKVIMTSGLSYFGGQTRTQVIICCN